MKYLWAYSIPVVAFLGIYFGGIFTFAAIIYAFVIIPLAEQLLEPILQKDKPFEQTGNRTKKMYDLLLYCNLLIVYGSILYVLHQLSSRYFGVHEMVGTALSLGLVLGSNGINVAHELGHREKLYERMIGKLLLVPSHYTHFFVEHNHGHHLHVATPLDPSTAKVNQNLYQFWLQSTTGTYRKAWALQRQLNQAGQITTFSPKNDMLWFTMIQIFYLSILFIFYSPAAATTVIIAGVVGFLMLETINYVEHYGLLREQLPSGRYERVTRQHSWNSNHLLGRIILYELTRHSDHHYKSQKKYQDLEHNDNSPQLPFGYPTCMLLSFVPQIWFRIMNARLSQKV